MKEVDLGVRFTGGTSETPDEVEVGTTGLYLVKQLQDNEWQMHFFPEGNKQAVKGKERLFALMFLSGFYSLITWWFSEENPYREDNTLNFVTNERQLLFMEKNLGSRAVSVYEKDKPADVFLGSIQMNAVRNDAGVMGNIGAAFRTVQSEKVN